MKRPDSSPEASGRFSSQQRLSGNLLRRLRPLHGIGIIETMQNIASTKRKLIILMLFLIPAGWAVYVQVLVRRSPPGAAITEPMGDILNAMNQIPKADLTSPAFQLRYKLEVGQSWTCEIESKPSTSGDDIFSAVGEEKPKDLPILRSGIYDLSVSKKENDRWQLTIVATKDGSLPQPFSCWIDAFGHISPSSSGDSEVDVRDNLYRKTGIYLPGPFKAETRAREWCSEKPGTSLGLPTAATIKRLQLVDAQDRMQPSGGLRFMGPLNYLEGVNQFKILSYRRTQVERKPWEGYVELVVRADFTYPESKIHMASGESRFRDIVDLQKDRKVGSSVEYALHIKQTMKSKGKQGP